MKNYSQPVNLPSKKELITYGIYAVIGIVVLVILILLIKWLSEKIKGDSLVKESKQSVKEKNLTYDEFSYKQMAASIFEAADGVGTDEDTIYRNLSKLKNVDDWKKLISVYDTDEDGFNLVSRLIYELDDSEKDDVNNILSKFNVTI